MSPANGQGRADASAQRNPPPAWALGVIGATLAIAGGSIKVAHDAESRADRLEERLAGVSATLEDLREDVAEKTRERFTMNDWRARQQWLEEVLRDIDRRLTTLERASGASGGAGKTLAEGALYDFGPSLSGHER